MYQNLNIFIIFSTILQIIHSIHPSINPLAVWGIVNQTLKQKRSFPHCPNLVFHNGDEFMNHSLFEVKLGQYHTHPSSFIDIRDIISNSHSYLDTAEFEDAKQKLKRASEQNIRSNGQITPCINVISIVNSTEFQVKDEDKNLISRVLMELLQFQTPIRSRHLIIVRLAETEDDLNPCYSRIIPIRLVPLFEMILFDFFTDARVIQNGQSWDRQPIFKITKEKGRWSWWCSDFIMSIKVAKKCQGSKECEQLEEHAKWINISKNISHVHHHCMSEFAPRQ